MRSTLLLPCNSAKRETGIPAECLRYLRFLELVFPAHQYGTWQHEGQHTLRDWTNTREWARAKLSVSGLTFRCIVADMTEWKPLGSVIHARMSSIGSVRIEPAYNCVLRPLGRIFGGELSAFYAHILLSWSWTSFDAGVSRDLAMEEEMELRKEQAERLVLGERYQSIHSSLEPPKSTWQHQSTSDLVVCSFGLWLFC